MEEPPANKAIIQKLNRTIQLQYGYDFSNYARSSYLRRIDRIMKLYHFKNVDALAQRIRTDRMFFEDFVRHLTVNTTEMFRDPSFWEAIRENVIPVISQHEVIRIWHAGCSSGEEVYSMAICLKEAGVYGKVKIFATDINDDMLIRAKEGKYSARNMEVNANNYNASGGKFALRNYYSEEEAGKVRMDPVLFENVVMRKHNLVDGNVFSKFDLILCRNVLIYFNRSLQSRVFNLFLKSMFTEGFLGIGARESLVWSSDANRFQAITKENIYHLKP